MVRRIFPLRAELGIGVTAYGVLSRGLLSGSKPASQADFRAHLPRFTREDLERNLRLVETLQQSALWRERSADVHIGTLGTGDVGRALGKGFVTLGHDVRMGSRHAKNEKALAWATETGAKASAGTFADAASFGEVVVLATLGVANESVLRMAGPDTFRRKVVIDATNPLDFNGGIPPRLAVSGNDSGGERVQRLLPDALVVKARRCVWCGCCQRYAPTTGTRHSRC